MLGILIINYKKYDLTVQCIDSVIKTVPDLPYRIYVLENGSQNESAEKLQAALQRLDQVMLILSDENLGYARGNNLLLEKAQQDGCDTVVISNNDILFHPGAIERLLQDLKEQKCLLAAPKLYNIAGHEQYSIKTHAYSFMNYLKYETYLRNFVSKDALKQAFKIPREPMPVYWATGAVFAADMDKFRRLGYFDPYTFLYFEEYILAQKAKLAGEIIFFDPRAAVTHHHGASTGGNANLFTRLENFKSEMYFLSRFWHYGYGRLLTVRLVRCLEVLFTFTKEKKSGDALRFLKQSRKILYKAKDTKHED